MVVPVPKDKRKGLRGRDLGKEKEQGRKRQRFVLRSSTLNLEKTP